MGSKEIPTASYTASAVRNTAFYRVDCSQEQPGQEDAELPESPQARQTEDWQVCQPSRSCLLGEGVGEAVFCNVAAAFCQSERFQEQPEGQEDAELPESPQACQTEDRTVCQQAGLAC